MSWHGHYQASEHTPARPRGHRGVPRDGYVTTCKQCGTGIFRERDRYVWQDRPIPGFIHEACQPLGIAV